MMRVTCTKLAGTVSLGAALLLAGISAANAGEVDAREQRQHQRILAGIEDGSLAPGEARRLAREQLRIERTEQRFRRNDGHLGPVERARLNHRQNHASRHIRRARHNDRTR